MSAFSNPENQADALFVEVLDVSKGNQGRATIQISSLTDCHVCYFTS